MLPSRFRDQWEQALVLLGQYGLGAGLRQGPHGSGWQGQFQGEDSKCQILSAVK